MLQRKTSIYDQDHQLFREAFVEFLHREVLPHREKWEAEGIVSREVWAKAGEMGFLVPQAPEEFSGLGQTDFRYQAIMHEELGYANEFGFGLGLHNSIVAPYILDYGSDALKRSLVPKLVSGEAISAIAMTEPDAGSDLAGMKSTAVDRGDAWILNGQKTFISNGNLADAIVVAAKTNLQNPKEMTLLVVDGSSPGLTKGKPFKKMGLHSQDTSELFFRDVVVPKDHVLGKPGMGFQYMTEKLAIERFTVGMSSIAVGQAALDETVRYVKERTAFGRSVAKFQNTRFKLSELDTQLAVGWAFVDKLIGEEVAGKLTAADASRAKYWLSELATTVADEGIQLHGGYGYMMEYPICQMYLNARVARIYAGSNEIMKTIIAKDIGL